MARPGPPLARLALLVLRYGRTEEPDSRRARRDGIVY
jgi:hypothetical protein